MTTMYFAMGYPWDSDENEKQKQLFEALKQAAKKAPIPMDVYLLNTRGGRLLTVCAYPEATRSEVDQKGGLWGESSIFEKWIKEAGAPMYQDADILGPRTHGPEAIDGPSKILDSFKT